MGEKKKKRCCYKKLSLLPTHSDALTKRAVKGIEEGI